MSEQVIAWLNAAGALIAGLAGLWGLVSAAGRPARLRREEALWRGLLEADTCSPGQRRIVENLHRYVGVQLMSLRLRPADAPLWRPVPFLFGALFAVMLGVLAAAIGIESARLSKIPPAIWIFVAALLVAAPMVTGAALVPIAKERGSRNAIVRRLLDDDHPETVLDDVPMLAASHRPNQVDRRRRPVQIVTLSLGATMAPAGVAATGTAAWVAFVPSIQTGSAGSVGATGILTYTAGVILVGRAWQALVEPPAPLTLPSTEDARSFPERSHATPEPRPTVGRSVLGLLAIAVLARPRRRS